MSKIRNRVDRFCSCCMHFQLESYKIIFMAKTYHIQIFCWVTATRGTKAAKELSHQRATIISWQGKNVHKHLHEEELEIECVFS